jgi:putative ABC transport system permease protein
LLLAIVGVYGVINQLVSQRTHEFGIRLALGAAPIDLARLVVSLGLKLALGGVVLGVPASLAFSRTLAGMLYGVSSSNPSIYILVALMLAGIALLAAALPARRATRVDPLVALRIE